MVLWCPLLHSSLFSCPFIFLLLIFSQLTTSHPNLTHTHFHTIYHHHYIPPPHCILASIPVLTIPNLYATRQETQHDSDFFLRLYAPFSLHMLISLCTIVVKTKNDYVFSTFFFLALGVLVVIIIDFFLPLLLSLLFMIVINILLFRNHH